MSLKFASWAEVRAKDGVGSFFNFTVRGFTILGCRWNPESGSIQLPVTFRFDETLIGRRPEPHRKKQVVCAFGVHINRLREALETALERRQGEPVPKEEEVEAIPSA